MKYLLLCCFEEKRWVGMPQSQRDEIMRDYHRFLHELDQSGSHLASAKLESSSSAATIRGGPAKLTVIDGPFAETKEQLGGYHLIECQDLAAAISIAKRIPTLPHGGAVEVRPLSG